MDSPVVKFVAVVFGWPLTVLAAIVAYEWYLEAFDVPTIDPPNRQRIQHPNHHPTAVAALEEFGALAAAERAAVRRNLGAAVVPVEAWLDGLRGAGLGLVCLGENHDEHTRRFLAEGVFPRLEVDTLFLEATAEGLGLIHRQIDAGSRRVALLKADISAIIDAARQKNPDLVVRGIEETDRQRNRRYRRGRGSREESMAANMRRWYEDGRRQVVLIGALHCKDRPEWFYRHAAAEIPGLAAGGMLNVRVVGEHQDGPIEAFVYFLDELGLAAGDFAIPDTDALDPRLRDWFLLLWDQTLGPYRAVVVFRPPAASGG